MAPEGEGAEARSRAAVVPRVAGARRARRPGRRWEREAWRGTERLGEVKLAWLRGAAGSVLGAGIPAAQRPPFRTRGFRVLGLLLYCVSYCVDFLSQSFVIF